MLWKVLSQPCFAPLQAISALEYASVLIVACGSEDRGKFHDRIDTYHTPRFRLRTSLFCNAIQEALSFALQEGAVVEAYMDDITLIAKDGETLSRAVEAAEILLNEGGLGMNMKKCQWISSHPGLLLRRVYEASRAAAGIGSAPPQKQAVDRTNTDLLNALPDLKQQRQIIAMCYGSTSTRCTCRNRSLSSTAQMVNTQL